MDTQSQTRKSAPFLTILLATTLLLCLISIARGASEPNSAVSFSPATINFGQIPSHAQPTQLLTVTFDRRIFPADHLPALRSDSPNGPALSLFSRFDGPKSITMVYRVAIIDHGENGPLQYNLSLVRDQSVSHEDAATQSAEDTGVSVSGEIVQGLDVDAQAIDFGQVKSGKGAAKDFRVGAFHSNMIGETEISALKSKANAQPIMPDIRAMSMTSSSPYVTAPSKRGMGLDGSAWETWYVVLSPNTPVGVLQAELVFRTGNGFSVTVPVVAEVTDAGHSEPKHSRKH